MKNCQRCLKIALYLNEQIKSSETSTRLAGNILLKNRYKSEVVFAKKLLKFMKSLE